MSKRKISQQVPGHNGQKPATAEARRHAPAADAPSDSNHDSTTRETVTAPSTRRAARKGRAPATPSQPQVTPPVDRKGRAKRVPGVGSGPADEDSRVARRAKEGTHDDAPDGGSLPVLGDALTRLSAQVHDVLNELGLLLSNALERKLRLGELLVEARGLCKAKSGNWAAFLESCGLQERTAREAMQFFRRRAEIDEQRHGRAGLTVSEVRLALALPRKVGRGKRSNPNATNDGGPAADSPSGAFVPSSAPVGREDEEPSHPGSQSDPGTGAEGEGEGGHAEDKADLLFSICCLLTQEGDEMIVRLASGPPDETVAALIDLWPSAKEMLGRVDAALNEHSKASGRTRSPRRRSKP